MAIAPISVAKLEKSTSNLSFGQKQQNEKQQSTTIPTGSMKTVPVMVLMAMNPSLLNANLPETFTEQNNIEFAQPETANNAEESIYTIAPDMQQIKFTVKNPYGWKVIDYMDIKYKGIIKSSNGTTYNVLFTSLKDKKPNEVQDVYLIPVGDMGRAVRGEYHPPCVDKLIIHDMPNGEQFSTVLAYEDVVDKDGKRYAFRKREIPIDDETAQLIYDMLQGFSRSPYVDKSEIRWTIVDTPELTKEIFNEIR